MSQYGLFRKIAQSNLTAKQREINRIKNDIITGFENSPSFETITISSVSYDVQIVEVSSLTKNPNKKKILMKPEDTIDVGDIVVWNGNSWLVTDLDDDTGIQYIGIIDKCNNTLKWLDQYNNIITHFCTVINKSLYTTGIDENKYIIVGDGQVNVTVSSNEDTLTLDRNKRFLFGYNGVYDCWKITQADRTSQPGVIQFVMAYEDINPETDDLINGIANAYDNTYSLTINQTSPLSQAVSTTGTLSHTLTLNNQPSTEAVQWVSSNTAVGTINSSTGQYSLLTTGTVKFTCRLVNNNNIKAEITVNVVSVPAGVKEVVISPNVTSILQGKNQTYEIFLYIDGIKQNNVFTFTASGADSSSCYGFEALSGNSFKVSCLKMSGLPLVVNCVSGSESKSISISLKGLW